MLEVLFLFLILLVMLFASYYLTKKEILSPMVISCALYACSTFIMLLYSKEWNVDLSNKAIAYILWALICLGIGEFLSNIIVLEKKKKKAIKKEINEEIKINKTLTIVLLIFVILTAILYYREIVKIVANSAYTKTEDAQRYSFLMQVRWAKTLENASVNKYVSFMLTMCNAIACIYTFIILYNYIYFKVLNKDPLVYLIIIGYICASFLTTGRASMLNFMIYALVLGIILISKKNNWNNSQKNMKIFSKIVIVFILMLALFYLAGTLTEKSSHYDNFMDNFANYFSSSIYNFNEYVKNPSNFSSSTNFFGIYTFSGLYSFLRKFGFDIPDSIVALEYTQCGDYLSNIYTPLRRYLQDFGVIGMSLIMFLIGFFYGKLLYINKKGSSFLTSIITAYLYFAIFFISIEERFFMDIIINRTVYMIILLIVFYEILVEKKIKIKFKRW